MSGTTNLQLDYGATLKLLPYYTGTAATPPAGYYPLPVRHGMTIGELAQLFNAGIGARLHVIAMKNWHRSCPRLGS